MFPISLRKKDTTLTRDTAVPLKPHLLLSSTQTFCWSEGEMLVALNVPHCFPPLAEACATLSCLQYPPQAFFTWLIFTHTLRLLLYSLLWELFSEPIGWKNKTFLCLQNSLWTTFSCLFDFNYLFLFLLVLALYLLISA